MLQCATVYPPCYSVFRGTKHSPCPRHPRTEVHVTSKQCYSKINSCFVFGTQDRGNNVCFGGSVKLLEIYQSYQLWVTTCSYKQQQVESSRVIQDQELAGTPCLSDRSLNKATKELGIGNRKRKKGIPIPSASAPRLCPTTLSIPAVMFLLPHTALPLPIAPRRAVPPLHLFPCPRT